MEIKFGLEIHPKTYRYMVSSNDITLGGAMAQVLPDMSKWMLISRNFVTDDPDKLDSLIQSDLIRRGSLLKPLSNEQETARFQ
ncbi:hypothetical protein [Sphingobacterium sp.]|uniref:hypothetical protein n=1 Tax=Sphingobacterium sp. TaxID=341027 RepID=UPI002897185B|nr:hypothetical protein [Sphingobacterium sp.]